MPSYLIKDIQHTCVMGEARDPASFIEKASTIHSSPVAGREIERPVGKLQQGESDISSILLSFS